MKRKMNLAAWAAVGLIVVGTAAFFGARAAAEVQAAPAPAAGKVYELRTYTTPPGKLEALHARFRDHTNALFVKHGMTLVGYWTPADGPEAENTLVYILAHDSREAAKKSWAAFAADPEWNAAKKASEADGPLTTKVESKFLNPTDYSPLK